MAGELQQTIDRLNAKTQILVDRYALIKEQRNRAVAQIRKLEADVERLTAQNEKLRTEVEFLKIATTISPRREDVARSRALLAELMREIDKCITELND